MAPDVSTLNFVLEQADRDILSGSDIIDLGLKQKREFEEKKAFAEFQQAFPTPKEGITPRTPGFIPRFGPSTEETFVTFQRAPDIFVPRGRKPVRVPTLQEFAEDDFGKPDPVRVPTLREHAEGQRGPVKVEPLPEGEFREPVNIFTDIPRFVPLSEEAENALLRGLQKTISDLVLGTPEMAARIYVKALGESIINVNRPLTKSEREDLPLLVQAFQRSIVASGVSADKLSVFRRKIQDIAEESFPRSEALKNIDINELGLSVLDPRNPEARRLFVATTAETLPMMAGALTVAGGVRAAGASLTAAAVAGGATGGFQEAINSFDEAKRRGKTDSEALEVFALVFGTTTALDATSIGFILSKLPKGLTRKVVSASAVGLVEGDTELVQETIQGLAVGDSIKEALQQGRVAFGPGVFLGASARAVISLGEQPDPSSRKSVSNILGIKPRDLPPEFTSKAKRQEFVDRLKDVAAKEETLLGDEENRALIEARLRSDEAVEERNRARTERINERAQQAFEEEVVEGLEDEVRPGAIVPDIEVEPGTREVEKPTVEPEPEPTPTTEPETGLTDDSGRIDFATINARIIELTPKTNKELNQIARDLGLKGLGGLKKSVVIERILDVEGREAEVVEPLVDTEIFPQESLPEDSTLKEQKEHSLLGIDEAEKAIKEGVFGQEENEKQRVSIRFGQGVITVRPTAEGIAEARSRISKFQTTGISKELRRPKTTAPRAKKAPKLKQPTGSNISKTLKPLIDKSGQRPGLDLTLSDGESISASTGQMAVVVRGDFGGSKESPIIRTSEGSKSSVGKDAIETAKSIHEKIRNAVPSAKEKLDLFRDLDTGELFLDIRRAVSLKGQVNVISIFRNPDGSIGFSAKVRDEGDISVNVQDDAEFVSEINGNFFLDIISMARATGNETVDIGITRSTSFGAPAVVQRPITISGDNFDAQLMPIVPAKGVPERLSPESEKFPIKQRTRARSQKTNLSNLIAESPAIDPEITDGTGVVFSPTRAPETAMQQDQEMPKVHYMPTREQAPAGWKKTTTAAKVFKALENVLHAFGRDSGIETVIRTGRLASRKALGQFHLSTFVIRLKHANDIIVATHEIGHAIHSLALESKIKKRDGVQIIGKVGKTARGFTKHPVPKGTRKELLMLGHNLYPGKRPPNGGWESEGIAEYFRVLLTDPQNAAQTAPKFHEWFHTKFLPDFPQATKAIIAAQDEINIWQQQGSKGIVSAQIVDESTLLQRAARFKTNLESLFSFEGIVEGLMPLDSFARHWVNVTGMELNFGNNPYLLAKAIRGTHTAIVERMVDHGMIDANGHTVGQSLRQAVAIVKKHMKDFVIYLYAKRAEALWNGKKRVTRTLQDGTVAEVLIPNPRDPGISLRDAQAVIKQLDEDEEARIPVVEVKRKVLRKRLEVMSLEKIVRRAKKNGIEAEQSNGETIETLKKDILISRIVLQELPLSRFKVAAQLVYDWNNGVLNYAAGMSPFFAEQVRQIRKIDPGSYIPLARIFSKLEERAFNVSRGTSRGTSQMTGEQMLNRLRGSGRAIRNPFDSMIENAQTLVRASHNRFIVEKAIALGKSVPGMGKFIEEVPLAKVPVFTASMDRLMKEVVKRLGFMAEEQFGDLDLGEIGQELVTFYATAKVQKERAGEKIIPMTINGKLRLFVIDPKLYSALDQLDSLHPTMNSAWSSLVMDGFLRPSKRIMTLGTTGMRTSFSLITNPLRDVQSLWIHSQTSANGFEIMYSWQRAMREGFVASLGGKESAAFEAYRNLGGEISQQLGIDRAITQRFRKKLFQGRVMRTISPLNVVDAMRQILQFPESASRIVEMEMLARDLGWVPGESLNRIQGLQLLLAAKEVTTDFSAQGADEFIKNLNSMIPFMNANLQGPRASLRAAGRTPIRFFTRGLQLTALTLALWWRYKDEEWYRTLRPFERHLFTYFPVGDELVRIPRPFELGALFQALPEAIVDAWYQQNPDAVKEWFQIVQRTMNPVFAKGPIPANPLVEEIFEQYTNRDTFMDTPIVNQSLDGKPVNQQIGPHTSQAAIFLSDISMHFPKKVHLSPVRIDHAITGIGGPVARDILDLLGLGSPLSLREKEKSDIPVLGTLFRRGGKVGTRPKVIDEIYDEFAQAKIEQADSVDLETSEERERRLSLQDGIKAISYLSTVRNATRETKLRRQITQEIANIAENVLRGKDISLNKHTEGYVHINIKRLVAPKITRLDKSGRIKRKLIVENGVSRPETDEEFQERKDERENNRRRGRNILLSVEATPEELIEVHKRLTKLRGGDKAVRTVNSSGRLTAFGKEIREIRKLKPE